MKAVMVKSRRNMILYARVFVVIRLLIAAILAIVIILLGNFYITQLTTRGQVVQTSFDAQSLASQEQSNLQRMNALVQSRFNQIFASLSGKINDPSLSNAGGLVSSDIAAREPEFDQGLATYQANYNLATSSDMATIRAILLNDNPETGPAIIANQQEALNAVTTPGTGLWPQYLKLQQQEINLLDSLDPTMPNHPTSLPTDVLNLKYDQAHSLLWHTNFQFTDLTNTWQRVVDDSVAMGKTVTSVGPSVALPVYVFNFIFICTMLLIFAIDLGFTNFQLKRSFLLYSEGKNSGNTPVPPSGSIPPVPQRP